MTQLGVRGRLFAWSLGLIVVVGLPAGLWLEHEQRTWLEEQTATQLARGANAARAALEEGNRDRSAAAVDPLADTLGQGLGARVTIIGPDGVVLGDSLLDMAELHAAGNHADRPEVVAARRHGEGHSRRYSQTLKTDMIYAARRTRDGSVVRVATDLAAVDAQVGRLRGFLLLAGVAGLLIAVAMSLLAAFMASRVQEQLGTLSGSYDRVSTELAQTARALRGERDRFQTVLESMHDAVLSLDGELRIRMANPAAIRLLSLSEHYEMRPLLDEVRVPQLHAVASTGRQSQTTDEFELPNGMRVMAFGTPLKRGGSVVALHDLTEIRRLERVRKDFVANVSHELRTPVAIIRANTETLLDGALHSPEHAERFVAGVHRNAERLAHLINDLLDLSRIEAGRYNFELGSTSPAEVAADVVVGIQDKADTQRVTLSVDIPPALRVHADVKALDQILTNLIDNAVKYTNAGGRITVSGCQIGERVQIAVTDDGLGIEPRHRNRIFERFYRVDKGRSREVGGTGLGLAICKHLVESMEGTIRVDPVVPNGSTFVVELPSAPPER